MSDSSSMMLIGVGGGGSAIARGVRRAFGEGLRFLTIDTDAATASDGDEFLLIGGDRLSGRGSGGDVVAARLAAEDSIDSLDPEMEGVRLAVIVTSLGGGTGGGATLETVKRLDSLGIPSIVFATTPFTFEGEDRQRAARGVMAMIEEAAGATFFVPLDKLVGNAERFDDAMRRAVDTMASAVTLFWRLVEKPGYIKLDAERIRHLVAKAGRGRFAAVSSAFGNQATSFELATVNDEDTFSGRISTVLLLFEANAKDDSGESAGGVIASKRKKRVSKPLGVGPQGRGRFNNAEPTIWNNEDLDIPTFLRRGINLDI